MDYDLSVQNVTKKFQDFTAVDTVSFDIEKGHFFSILGPSGCGKTTLLRMIAGFDDPNAGRIEIRGQNVIGIPPNKRPVNMVFQHLALFPMMNVAENVAFGLRRRGEKDRAKITAKVSSMLSRVGLQDFENKKISQLSGGQKQRVAIARSLVLDPAVLLLDEPLGALDLKLRDHMKVELKKLQSQVGTTFMYITHDQSEALVMSDYVAVMNNGKFEQIDTPSNLYNCPQTPFVAQFVGDNNSWSGTINKVEDSQITIETDDGYQFKVTKSGDGVPGSSVNLFLRPEAILIQPDPELKQVNRFSVIVSSILFDGAGSRLLVKPLHSTKELIVSLPQNRQFDHIKPSDQIEIGWSEEAGIYFI
ncbi:MAG: ABC transporter ATP-binding protein [Deltaproteobacteria bacterium]|jgi:spermidine/putrescine transport system ATP-binding protein|nr:ABC transporter ATP-binding protein [Deltaproteobacteria bacterium]MBT4262718.1 ABC transporter ATP-binding protein [Deltaproteobacteria bacterium]MBT4640907.1 ABC transporter ATP-binding protein [Deltaproteobacteria bacterium]MBT6498763.1 ABC transporter ATP-binding protein [Deltaproteobacteria bacterium]MBT6615273.1 ABC transporter ATP-binding protein [Deltaproteobacteria bacterium]